MRIMLIGAGGFIGRYILSELLAAGHDVVGVVRTPGNLPAAFPGVRFFPLDLVTATDEEAWRSHVTGIDCIINAAGILKGAGMEAVHARMPEALYRAALRAGVKHAVLISAVSAREDVATDYAASKLAGEQVLRSSGLGWTILRPSLVYGDGSYGGTSLLRGMAGLPFLIPLPGDGEFAFTPIHAQDLARSVGLICGNDAFHGQTLEPVGPETLNLKDLLARYKAWLGFGRARFLSVPMPVMRLLGRVGDIAGAGPVSTNSLVQMVAGNAGDSAAYARSIGFAPRSLNGALSARPAQVQDRWQARLFFVAPAIKAMLVLLWLASAWLGLSHGSEATQSVVAGLGLPTAWADPLRIGGSLLDLAVALMVLFDKNARWSSLAQFSVVIGYTVVIGTALPGLWLDPLGPLLKNFPILLLVVVHGVIGDKR